MTTSNRRIALLTGVSLATLGLASPAIAAPHDTLDDGIYPGATATADTVEICDLDADEPGVDPCFFGVIDGVSVPQAAATAVVSTPANGQIVHHPGATGTLVNGYETAEIGAIASAYNTAAGASAQASVLGAIFQSTVAADASLNIYNTGNLLIDAVANASVGETGNAYATAVVTNAIHQAATEGGGDITLSDSPLGGLRATVRLPV